MRGDAAGSRRAPPRLLSSWLPAHRRAVSCTCARSAGSSERREGGGRAVLAAPLLQLLRGVRRASGRQAGVRPTGRWAGTRACPWRYGMRGCYCHPCTLQPCRPRATACQANRCHALPRKLACASREEQQNTGRSRSAARSAAAPPSRATSSSPSLRRWRRGARECSGWASRTSSGMGQACRCSAAALQPPAHPHVRHRPPRLKCRTAPHPKSSFGCRGCSLLQLLPALQPTGPQSTAPSRARLKSSLSCSRLYSLRARAQMPFISSWRARSSARSPASWPRSRPLASSADARALHARTLLLGSKVRAGQAVGTLQHSRAGRSSRSRRAGLHHSTCRRPGLARRTSSSWAAPQAEQRLRAAAWPWRAPLVRACGEVERHAGGAGSKQRRLAETAFEGLASRRCSPLVPCSMPQLAASPALYRPQPGQAARSSQLQPAAAHPPGPPPSPPSSRQCRRPRPPPPHRPRRPRWQSPRPRCRRRHCQPRPRWQPRPCPPRPPKPPSLQPPARRCPRRPLRPRQRDRRPPAGPCAGGNGRR